MARVFLDRAINHLINGTSSYISNSRTNGVKEAIALKSTLMHNLQLFQRTETYRISKPRVNDAIICQLFGIDASNPDLIRRL